MNNCAKMFVIASAFAVSASSVYAVDYLLEAGQTDTISTNVTYANMDVYGDLSVYVPGGTKKDYKKYVRFTSNLNLIGGRLTIDPQGQGPYFQFGYSGGNDDPDSIVNITNGVDGSFGSISIRNINAAVDTSLCCEELYIRKEGEGTAPENGIIDFARIENGCLFARQLYNYSSCTGRVTIAGGGVSYFCRRGKSSISNFIENGPFIVQLEDSSLWRCYFYNNRGDFNKEDEVVHSEGNGHVAFSQRPYKDYDSDTAVFRKGAFLNHNGNIIFRHDDNSHAAFFDFAASEIIGPNVTNVYNETAYEHPMRIRFLENVVQTLKNVSLRGAGVHVTGKTGSRLRISADDADRTVKVNIHSGDALVVEKIGAKEMIVSATTNFSHLVVSEGAVRFTESCVVEDLKMKNSCVLVADGCEVRIHSNEENLEQAFSTVNGGKIVFVSNRRTMHYDPGALQGFLHFSGGTNVYSCYGLDHKWWRWTFFSVNGGPVSLRHRGLYLYGTDGEWCELSAEIDNKTAAKFDAPPTTPLAVNGCRWWYHSETNLTVLTGDSFKYNYLGSIKYWFNYSKNGNNTASLKTPVIDPENPKSHVGVEVHIPSTTLPIVGYNMRTHSKTYYANGWKVEASRDGLVWETVDVRSNQTFSISSAYNTYDDIEYKTGIQNAKELFHFTGYRRDGLTAMSSPLALQADGGAVVDLRAFTGGQSIDALTVDCSAGTGKIFGAKIAESGVLTITNADALLDGSTLPLSIPDSIDGGNIKNWVVRVDGVQGKYLAKLMADGTLRIMDKGTVIILR